MAFSFNNWTENHTQVLLNVQQGLSTELIAAKMNKSPSWVSKIRQTPLFQKRFTEVQEEIKNELANRLRAKLDSTNVLEETMDIVLENLPDAVKCIVKFMKHGENSDKMKFEAACKVIDMAGFKPTERTITRTYTLEELQSANSTIKENITITERLTNLPSRFILRSVSEPRLKESPATDEDSSRASQNRQEVSTT